jgi:hypothetical protein
MSVLITEGHHWVPLLMSHSPNPHTNLLNVFIQIANNKGILKKRCKFAWLPLKFHLSSNSCDLMLGLGMDVHKRLIVVNL